MTLGLFLYRVVTSLISPFTGWLLKRRVSAGKEDRGRLHERQARNLPQRPDGDLLWLHGASVGESLLQLELARHLIAEHTRVNLLLTCQTQTGARRINSEIEKDPILSARHIIQQMAPIDTPGTAKRFVEHWQQSAAIFAESDIWPNLLLELQKRSKPAALVTARLTERSLRGWSRWPKTAETVFGAFDLILASDKKTASGLSLLSKKEVPCIGSLKTALPPPDADPEDLAKLRAEIGDKEIWVAASTHPGEEAIVLDALMQMSPRPFLIVAPRHPERGDAVEGILTCSNLNVTRRSQVETLAPETDILLADTMGEMGLWYRLADSVYLGGGHAPGVGGHNFLEALRLGKPVITGPGLFNIEDLARQLIDRDALTIVEDASAMVAAYPGKPPSEAVLKDLEGGQFGVMQETVSALTSLFKSRGIGS